VPVGVFYRVVGSSNPMHTSTYAIDSTARDSASNAQVIATWASNRADAAYGLAWHIGDAVTGAVDTVARVGVASNVASIVMIGAIASNAFLQGFIPSNEVAAAYQPIGSYLTNNQLAEITLGGVAFTTNGLAIDGTNSSAPIFIGANDYTTGDYAVVVSRDVSASNTSSHAYLDYSHVTADLSVGYNSFDAQVSIDGTNELGHYNSFQSRPTYGSTGIISAINGYTAEAFINMGTVSSLRGFVINGFTVFSNASVGSVQGLRINELPEGDAAPTYSILTLGRNSSLIQGGLEVGYAGATNDPVFDVVGNARVSGTQTMASVVLGTNSAITNWPIYAGTIQASSPLTCAPTVTVTKADIQAALGGELRLTLTCTVQKFTFQMDTFDLYDAGIWTIAITTGSNTITADTNTIQRWDSIVWTNLGIVPNDISFRKVSGVTNAVKVLGTM